jgi:hypothetical protein
LCTYSCNAVLWGRPKGEKSSLRLVQLPWCFSKKLHFLRGHSSILLELSRKAHFTFCMACPCYLPLFLLARFLCNAATVMVWDRVQNVHTTNHQSLITTRSFATFSSRKMDAWPDLDPLAHAGCGSSRAVQRPQRVRFRPRPLRHHKRQQRDKQRRHQTNPGRHHHHFNFESKSGACGDCLDSNESAAPWCGLWECQCGARGTMMNR